MSTYAINKNTIKTKSLVTGFSVLCAVVLPQIFHMIGIISGHGGAAIGEIFLPMHIPVLFAGLLGGPVAGLMVGILSPLASYIVSGMPSAVLLPVMTAELAGYGLVAGLMARNKIPSFFKVVIAQISGKILRISTTLFAIYVMGSVNFTLAGAYKFVLAGLPGIIIQLMLIPLLLPKLESLKEKL